MGEQTAQTQVERKHTTRRLSALGAGQQGLADPFEMLLLSPQLHSKQASLLERHRRSDDFRRCQRASRATVKPM